MNFLKYIFSKKYREDYTCQLIRSLNSTEDAIEKIYTDINNDKLRKAA